jgi:hypothetical protein
MQICPCLPIRWNAYQLNRMPHKVPSTNLGNIAAGCKADDSIAPVTASELKQTSDIVEQIHFRPDSKPERRFSCLSRDTKCEMVRHIFYFFARSIINFVTSIKDTGKDALDVDCESTAESTLHTFISVSGLVPV